MAKQVKKQRAGGMKLACLKVINSTTNRSIFPMELLETQTINKAKFPLHIYRGDISKLKPR